MTMRQTTAAGLGPHVSLSVASVELPDGKQFEQYMFRMRRCAMTVVLDEPGDRLLLIWGTGSSWIGGAGRCSAPTSTRARTVPCRGARS